MILMTELSKKYQSQSHLEEYLDASLVRREEINETYTHRLPRFEIKRGFLRIAFCLRLPYLR
jgi:transcription elongation factor GreA-like protein